MWLVAMRQDNPKGSMFFKVILFLASLGPLCCVRALWLWRAGALSGRGAGLLAAVGPLAVEHGL